MQKDPRIVGNCKICKEPVYKDDIADIADQELMDKVFYHKDIGYACTKHEGIIDYWEDVMYYGRI